MQTSLKKSLYWGLAAVSMVAAGAAATTNASAATPARVTSLQTLKTDATLRNVVPTGSNAIATKAATLRGARTVKSAATLANAQAVDNIGQYNYRAYAMATTNRGSVYYKVVSFDKTVRGWIYGGKITNNFAGGLASFSTMKSATLPTGNFTAKTATTQLWNQPPYAQYKVGRSKATLNTTEKFAVSAAATQAKSGVLYYQISSSTNAAANGKWVAASDVTNTPVTPEVTVGVNQVGIKFIDADTGKQVGTTSVQTNVNYLTQTAPVFLNGKISGTGFIPSGYTASAGTAANNFNDGLSAANVATNAAAVANASYGKTISYYVKAVTSSNYFNNSTVLRYKMDNAPAGTSYADLTGNASTTGMLFATAKTATGAEKLTALATDSNTAGATGTNVTTAKIAAAAAQHGLGTFYLVQGNRAGAGVYVTKANDLKVLRDGGTTQLIIQKFVLQENAILDENGNSLAITGTTARKLPYLVTSTTVSINTTSLAGKDEFDVANIEAAIANPGLS